MSAAIISTNSRVIKSPKICGEDPCIRNTRITIHGLVEWKNLGLSDAEIQESIPGLTDHDLSVAWKYYEDHREEIDSIIQAESKA